MKKRYKIATCESSGEGFAILLDGKQAQTPGGKALKLGNEALARAIAQEWQSQGEDIHKETMPLTQFACIALDLIAERRDGVLSDILAYGDTDLVCYRAGDIPELEAQQAKLLDPIIGWAERRFNIALAITGGLMPVKQPAANRMKLATALLGYDDLTCAALTASVGPLGSLILALAFIEGRINAKEAFALSHLEEAFETAKWGADEEKDARLKKLEAEIACIEKFLAFLLSSPN